MRLVVQRVSSAWVAVQGRRVAGIGPGLLVLAGIATGDSPAIVERLARRVAEVRIFEDGAGKMNLSAVDTGAEVLCVSQFTLYGDMRRGRRPSFDRAAPGPVAQPLFDRFCESIEHTGLRCARGVFGAEMEVGLVNDGPVTLVLDSEELERPRRA
ncbi:MAG TPA: D-aminoacyl-tRNA deacylase [Tepidiformaceae bacterium]|nr:D-aminoacyl-tRNA deacylase [Tepidiformaceae bacterium]